MSRFARRTFCTQSHQVSHCFGVATPAEPRGETKKSKSVQILGGEKLLKFLKSAGEIFLSGLRGAKHFSDRFSDHFRVYQTVFRIDLNFFSGAISFCRHAALTHCKAQPPQKHARIEAPRRQHEKNLNKGPPLQNFAIG